MADTGFDASQFSVDPSLYVVDGNSDEARWKRDWAYRFGAETGLSGNETYEQWYNRTQNYLDRLYEQDSLAKQRQYELYADSTRYQRLVDDLKKAGLNPWLALNGGSSSAGSVSVASHDASANKGPSLKSTNKNLSSVVNLITGALATAFMVSRFL